jgi:hypothetical protein
MYEVRLPHHRSSSDEAAALRQISSALEMEARCILPSRGRPPRGTGRHIVRLRRKHTYSNAVSSRRQYSMAVTRFTYSAPDISQPGQFRGHHSWRLGVLLVLPSQADATLRPKHSPRSPCLVSVGVAHCLVLAECMHVLYWWRLGSSCFGRHQAS